MHAAKVLGSNGSPKRVRVVDPVFGRKGPPEARASHGRTWPGESIKPCSRDSTFPEINSMVSKPKSKAGIAGALAPHDKIWFARSETTKGSPFRHSREY